MRWVSVEDQVADEETPSSFKVVREKDNAPLVLCKDWLDENQIPLQGRSEGLQWRGLGSEVKDDSGEAHLLTSDWMALVSDKIGATAYSDVWPLTINS